MPSYNLLHIIGGIVILLGTTQNVSACIPGPAIQISTDSSNPMVPVNPSELVSMEMKLQYPMIFPSTSSELLEPVLLSLNVNETAQNTRTPLDIVWVLDTSGSMYGEKIDLLKESLRYLITFLTENDRISIIRFSSSAEQLTPLKKVSESNEAYFQSIIDSLYADGNTNIASGLSEALRVLQQREDKNRVASIFLLSDGLDNYGNAEIAIRSLLERYQDLGGYSIHTFGYGYDHDPKLMGQIANFRDGNFYFIEKLETTDESFADALGGLLTVVGERVTLSVKAIESTLFSRVSFEKAFGGELLWKKSNDGWYETSIRQLSSGKSKNYVLMLAIGKYMPNEKLLNPDGVTIAKAKLKMREAGTKKLIEKEIELKVNITQNQTEFKRQDPDVKVLLNYYRVRAGEVMLESSQLAEKGSYEEGRQKLENLKSEMGNSSLSEDGFVQGTMTDLNNTILEMNPEVYNTLGKHHIQQNSGSYIAEKSNPYMNNSALSYNTSNTMQSGLVNQTRARRYTINDTNYSNGSNNMNFSHYANITNGQDFTNGTNFTFLDNDVDYSYTGEATISQKSYTVLESVCYWSGLC